MENHKQENKQLKTKKEIKSFKKPRIKNRNALNLFVEFEKIENSMRQLAEKYSKFSCDAAIFNAIANSFSLAQDKFFENFVKGEKKT